jgi:hypothetical protein
MFLPHGFITSLLYKYMYTSVAKPMFLYSLLIQLPTDPHYVIWRDDAWGAEGILEKPNDNYREKNKDISRLRR